MRANRVAPLLGLALVAAPATAAADPLDVFQLYALMQYVECTEACPEPLDLQRFQCLADCGGVDPDWEKNGVTPVDRADLDLALLEKEDEGAEDVVCYAGRGREIVIPGPLCAGAICEDMPACSPASCALPVCDALPCGPEFRPVYCFDSVCEAEPVRDAADCADGDSDGVPRWLEDHVGSSDEDPPGPPFGGDGDVCTVDDPCNFQHRCEFDPLDLGRGVCRPRGCGADCTAFHMEVVAEDDQQVLIHVFFDHSPAPARILDLRIEYDPAALTLEDARPLPHLVAQGKQLSVSHGVGGRVRLVILDESSEQAIIPGPLVELVMLRHGTGSTTVDFALDDESQFGSMAPLQGRREVQELLENDRLWGDPLELADPGLAGTRLRLWYGFDAPGAPLDYRSVPSADEICAVNAECTNEDDAQLQTQLLARLESLQDGFLASTDAVEGIRRSGAFMNGNDDHLRLPVHFQDPLEAAGQSFSFSVWFYTEGNTTTEADETPQVVFSHTRLDERSRFGLVLQPREPAGGGEPSFDNGARLSFFEGDLLSDTGFDTLTVAEDVGLRRWHHVGFSLDVEAGQAQLYYDGEAAGSYDFEPGPAVVSCPGFRNVAGVVLKEEGQEGSAGSPAETVFFAERRSGLFRIKRLDSSAVRPTEVIGDGEFSYRDPDFSPVLGKLVYSANVGGNFEIWIANADGSEREQISVGFGDTERGIFARKPKWAPDGSGIVFESNAFDVQRQHNVGSRDDRGRPLAGRGYQLYFIEYDARANDVAIPLEAGGTASQLDYDARLADETLGAYQLTRSSGNNVNAWWLSGYDDEDHRGEIVYDASDARFDGHEVRRLSIPRNLRSTSTAAIENLVDDQDGVEQLTLLSAFHSRDLTPGGVVRRSLILYRAERGGFAPAEHFELDVAGNGNARTVSVRFAPGDFPETCWDLDRDGRRDDVENRTQAPPAQADPTDVVDEGDCYPIEISSLFVQFDELSWTFDEEASAPGSVLDDINDGGVDKDLRLAELFTVDSGYVRVEVVSPRNDLPLRPGTVATLHFDLKPGEPASDFSIEQRDTDRRLFVKDLEGGNPTELALGDELHLVDSAAFAPDGDRLLLAGISAARPVLLATADLTSTAGAERLLASPARIRGLSWRRDERLHACNWVAGYQHPQTRRMLFGLRGGLDDLRYYSGLRDPDAFRSEAARGLERLEKEARDGELDTRIASCPDNEHLACPPYHLCVAGECAMVACDPAQADACTDQDARCTLRPASVEQENGPFRWVCSAECQGDRECFTEQCTNGPCRFCDVNVQACVECRTRIDDFGGFRISALEGCPDRDDFYCAEGSCLTECYSFDDGQARYLCDPTLEYCKAGRCALLDWDWPDFAPATFGGLTETVFHELPGDLFRTDAVGELTPIKVLAYGVEDYLHPPELIVEGKLQLQGGGELHAGEWIRLGRIYVHNKTAAAAGNKPYYVHSPHPVTHLRMRLVIPPYEDKNGAATGLGATNKDFCDDDLARTAQNGGPLDPERCFRRTPGSRASVGYRVGIPFLEAAKACEEDPDNPDCPEVAGTRDKFLYGGQHAVVIDDVMIDGDSVMAAMTKNLVCSYEGDHVPNRGAEGGPSDKLFFGAISREESLERDAFCAANPGACNDDTELLDYLPHTRDRSFALLNCNFFDPTDAVNGLASVEFQLADPRQRLTRGFVNERDANFCFVEVDQVRVERCYEWEGGGASLDAVNSPTELFRSLEFTLMKSFGHDRGFDRVELPTHPLVAVVSGYNPPPAGENNRPLVLRRGRETFTIPGNGEHAFPTALTQRQRYQVAIEQQPRPREQECILGDGASGTMGDAPARFNVVCGGLSTVSGTVRGLARGERVVLDLNRQDEVVVSQGAGTDDLPFAFGRPLAHGEDYVVRVRTQPLQQICTVLGGSGIASRGQNVEVTVDCTELRHRDLGGTVTGLNGELVLRNSENGDETVLTSSGPFVMGQQVFPGDAYEVFVEAQPTSPHQRCSVTNGSGVMPNQDLTDIDILCESLPTFAVGGMVFGLFGPGLELELNGGEVLAVDQNGTFEFEGRLPEGASYSVAVVATPTAPAQTCEVFAASGTMPAEDVYRTSIVCELQQADDTYRIGGTVSGLVGAGLQVELGGGHSIVVLSDGDFAFGAEFNDGFRYDVQVARQPQNPIQYCEVRHGGGIVSGADVNDVEVVCGDGGRVSFEIEHPDLDDVVVQVLLISQDDDALVAASHPQARIVDGSASIAMRSARPAGADPPIAAMPPGRFSYYIYVDDNRGGDTGRGAGAGIISGAFQVGEQAARGVVVVRPDRVTTVNVDEGDFAESVAGEVEITATGVAQDASFRCFWSEPGTAGAYPLPPPPDAPVVAESSMTCNSDDCFDGDSADTTSHQPLFPGRYALTCWVDSDSDGALNGGDYFGTDNDVVVDGGSTQLDLDEQ